MHNIFTDTFNVFLCTDFKMSTYPCHDFILIKLDFICFSSQIKLQNSTGT